MVRSMKKKAKYIAAIIRIRAKKQHQFNCVFLHTQENFIGKIAKKKKEKQQQQRHQRI